MTVNWLRFPSSRAAPVGLLALLVLWGTATPGLAENKHRLVGNSYVVYVSADGGNALLISGPKRVNKASYDEAQDATAAGVVTRGSPLTDRYWSGNGQYNIYGSYIQSHFDDHAYGPGCAQLWTCDDYVDGHSKTYWWGQSPYYATAMQQIDKIWEDGCVMSVSVPAGVSFSVVTTAEVSWDTGRIGNNDIWYINHYYSGIHFSTGCGRWNLTQQTTGHTWFGYNYYTTQASKSTTPP